MTTKKQQENSNWYNKFVVEMGSLITNRKVNKVIKIINELDEKGRDNLTREDVEKIEMAIDEITLTKKEQFVLFGFYKDKVKSLQAIDEVTDFIKHNFNKRVKLYRNKERELRSELGTYLKNLRKSLGLTLADVQNLSSSNISVSYISRIENSNRPSPSLALLKDLSNIYNTPLKEVLEVAGIPMEEEDTFELSELLDKYTVTYNGRKLSKEKKKNLLKMVESEFLVKN